MITAKLVNLENMRREFEEFTDAPEVDALFADIHARVEVLQEETDNYYNIKLENGVVITGLSTYHLTDLQFKEV